jgi:hypothetical protein
MTLRWVCAERGCYKETLPDWGILKGCFPRGIEPTDVDGMVHLGECGVDRFLFLEKKPAGKALSNGQRGALSALARHPGTTSLAMRGNGQDVEELLWYPGPDSWKATDWAGVRRFCAAWSSGADGAEAWHAAAKEAS